MNIKYILIIVILLASFGCKQKTKKLETAPLVKIQENTAEWIKNKVIYEVNIRQYTPEGTFNAFKKYLPELKDLGVDILWFMPIFPISEKNRKGKLGSYYSIKDYRSVNPDFGSMDDFKKLVKEAHSMGFKVILDWVANHTGWDNKLIEEHPEWYTQEDGEIVPSVPDWTDVADLNYDNKELREYMIESMKFWIKEADIDGFRCDVALMVPTDFWEKARLELESIKPMIMLAEAWQPELVRSAFDICYAWDLMHTMNDIAVGKKNNTNLNYYFNKIDTMYPTRAILMNFITNHDENSWNGTIDERYGKAHKTYAVMIYTVPGIPLIYSGQEAGLNHRLKFFEKDSIPWKKNPNLKSFYKRLNKLKHTRKALEAGIDGGKMTVLNTDNKMVYSYKREKGKDQVVVILNFSNQKENVIISGLTKKPFREYFTGKKTVVPARQTLKPFEYQVWVTK